ncbi:MAG: hypothetical protein ACREIH_07865 [Nitrospiraceae bacterium]
MLWDVFIGLVSAAVLTTVLGMLGFFNPLAFASVLAAGPLLNLRNPGAFVAPWRALRESVSSLRGQILLGLALIISIAIVIFPTAAPEIFYDALYYHLGLPWQYLITGEIRWRPSVVHSAFPAYIDVLFGICLGLGGAGVAKFFNLLLFILGWCATAAFVHEVIGDKRAALVGAITVSTIPGVVIMSTMCAIDAALIGFAAMSALAIARMRRSGPDDLKHLALSAALTAGFVAGSKYTGLWLVGALALSILTSQGPRFAARLVLLFAGTAILIAAPWYVRNLMVIGDPIYPVLSGLLGDGDARWAIERIQRDVPSSGLSWASLNTLVIGLVNNPDRFGAGAETGLLMPLGFVALLVGALRVPFLRPWTVAVVAYIPVWLSQASVMRYVYPIFPFSALGVAWAACLALERLRRPALGTAALVILAVAPLSQSIRVLDSLYDGRDVAALFSGTLSKSDYLARRLAYYPAAQWLNIHTPSDAHVLYLGETRLLYLDRPVSFSSAYDFSEIARLLAPNAPPLFSQLRNRGITHIVINGREIERLRTGYEYLPLSVDAERRLRAALAECRIAFRKSGVQICELPR